MKIQFFLILLFSSGLLSAQTLDDLDSLKALLETPLTDQEKVDVYNDVAKIYTNSDSAMAEDYIAKAKAMSQTIDYGKGIVDAKNVGGWVLMTRGYYTQAKTAFREVLSLAEDFKVRQGLALGNNGLGNCHIFTGRYDSAALYFKRSMDIQRELRDFNGLSLNYNNLGNLGFYKGNYKEALKNFRRSIQLKDSLGDEVGKIPTYLGIGNVYFRQGIYSQALENYLIVITEMEKIGDKKGQGLAYNNTGLVYLRQNDLNKAMEYFQRSLAVRKELGDQGGMANSYNSIASIYNQLNDHENAIEYYRQSLTLNEKMGSPRGLATAYNSLASSYLDEGDIEKALEYQEKSLKIRRKIKDQLGLASVMLEIGRSYLAQEKYQAAYNQVKEGLVIAESLNSFNYLRKGNQLLAAIASKRSLYQEAFEAHIRYKQYSDSISNDQNTKKIARLEAEFEFQKERDITAFENRQKELSYEKELAEKSLINKAAIGGGALVLLILLIVFRAYQVNKQKNRELMEKNIQISELRETEKQMAEETIALKERELTTVTMLSHERNTLLQQIGSQINGLSGKVDQEVIPDIREIKRTIKSNLNEESWNNFMYQFEKVHPEFFNKLKELYPTLTPHDLRICAYLRVGMDRKEIASISTTTTEAVKKSLYRLKKKMVLDAEVSLREYLMEI